MNQYKRIASVVVFSCMSGALLATDYTYSWDASTKTFSPDPGDRIRFAMHPTSTSQLFKMLFSPDVGGKITVTGDEMQFYKESSTAAQITNTTASTVVFKNAVNARSVHFITTAPHPGVNWEAYPTHDFLQKDWTTIAAGVKLDDYDLADCSNQAYWDSSDTQTRKPAASNVWYNSGWTMYARNVVREDGWLECQFQTFRGSAVRDERTGRERRQLCVVKVQMRQQGADVQARILSPAYLVWSDDPAPLGLGTDVDLLEIGEDLIEYPVFTGPEKNNGLGMNVISFNRKTPVSTFRFEGSEASFSGSAVPFSFVRVEIGDAALWSGTTYPTPQADSELALLDNSATYSWRSESGSGTMEFATTKPTESPAVTNVIVLNRTGSSWGKKPLVVKGLEDNPMVLDIKTGQSLPTNGAVTVKSGGILRLSAANCKDSGLSNGSCEFIVEGGGRLEQANVKVLGINQKISLNGGKLVLGVDVVAAYDLGVDLRNLSLRNGAEIVNVREDKKLRIGNAARPGLTWTISGSSPSTNAVLTQFVSPVMYGVGTNTFNVAKTGDFEADFVFAEDLQKYSGGNPSPRPYDTNTICKVGRGTLMFAKKYTVPGEMLIRNGFIRLGSSGCLEKGAAKILFQGGGLSTADGTVNDTGDKIALEENATIALGRGATIAFADSSSVPWVSGKRLDVTVPTDGDGDWEGAIRFGTDANGLTESQVACVRVNGRRIVLDGSGYAKRVGFALIVR